MRLLKVFLTIGGMVGLLGLACDSAPTTAPTGSTIVLSVNPAAIAVDGQAEVGALVRKGDGSAVNPGTEVVFTTTLGELDPQTAATDSSGIATAMLRAKGQAGTATVTANTGGATQAAVDIQIGSAAASITIQATPTNLPQEGGRVDLVAVVRDGNGQVLANFAVTFNSDIGALDSLGGSVLTNNKGEAADRLRVSAQDINSLGDTFFTVGATTASEDGTLLEDTATITVSGAVSFISLQGTPASVPETGGTIEFLALVRDDLGDPVAKAGVNFLTETGTLASGGALVSTNKQGEATDTLTVTEADLTTVTGGGFTVRAQTVGSDGSLLEATFRVGSGTSFTLTVSVTGSGSVTSTPAGIDCGQQCTATFPQSQQVTLTAAPSGGATTVTWGGSCVGTNTTVSVTMTSDKSCTATFS